MPDPEPSIDPHHQRDTLAVVQRAVRLGWNIPDQWMDALPKIAAKIASDANAPYRDRLRAIEALRAMESDRVRAAVDLLKIERADEGKVEGVQEIVIRHVGGEPLRPRASDADHD